MKKKQSFHEKKRSQCENLHKIDCEKYKNVVQYTHKKRKNERTTKMKLEEFDYNLPEELIAQVPIQQRDESRLMVVDRKKKNNRGQSF